MPLTLLYYPSFSRSLKSLDPAQRKIVHRILKALFTYYMSNCQLYEAHKTESRFFYKKLRSPYYEDGVESKIRIVIERKKSECLAVLAGDHDDIKRFLSS